MKTLFDIIFIKRCLFIGVSLKYNNLNVKSQYYNCTTLKFPLEVLPIPITSSI